MCFFTPRTEEYFKENLHLFGALDFLAELTQHIPPRRVQLIRRYRLYSSRTKGRLPRMPHVAARAPQRWRASHLPEASDPDGPGFEPLDDGEEVSVNARKRAWARLLAKVYEIDPLVCPNCGWKMKVIAVVQDPVEIRDILTHLVKTGRMAHSIATSVGIRARSCDEVRFPPRFFSLFLPHSRISFTIIQCYGWGFRCTSGTASSAFATRRRNESETLR